MVTCNVSTQLGLAPTNTWEGRWWDESWIVDPLPTDALRSDFYGACLVMQGNPRRTSDLERAAASAHRTCLLGGARVYQPVGAGLTN